MENIFELDSPVSFCAGRKGDDRVNDFAGEATRAGASGGTAGAVIGLGAAARSAGSAAISTRVMIAAAPIIAANATVGAAAGVGTYFVYKAATFAGADEFGKVLGGALYEATH